MNATELANIGDHSALNFLNTRLRPWGEEIDLLASGEEMLKWLVSTDLIDDAERDRLAKTFTVCELDESAAQARGFREWLRDVVSSWVHDSGPNAIPAAVTARLNRVLATGNQHVQLSLTADGCVPELVVRHQWDDAAQLLALPAEAAADLLVHGDRDRIHLCDGPLCELWFYDRTKAHRRRWCSMAVCGNRDKVQKHRQRQSAGSAR